MDCTAAVRCAPPRCRRAPSIQFLFASEFFSLKYARVNTLREAVDRGFDCIAVGDACAAGDPAAHEAMLACIAGEGGILGEVQDTDAVVAAWSA